MNLTNYEDDNIEVQGLIDLMENSPDNYKHLQMFLHRERPDYSQQDYEFLMVSPKVFGKVRILNVSVEDDSVTLEFKDCKTQQVGNVRIDINDSSPQTFFICWQDIKKMILDETRSMCGNDEFLDFDY